MARAEQDTINWQASGLQLGVAGLDLRQPADPRALAKLINARFRDERTVERRLGYLSTVIRDSGGYPIYLDTNDDPVSLPINSQGWIYGHGQFQKQSALTSENNHLPAPGVARGILELDGTKAVWTGDRLLAIRDDGYDGLGASAFWGDDTETTPIAYGLPAYIPVQTDSPIPGAVDGAYLETCLTADERIIAATTGDDSITVQVISRSNNALIDKTVFTGTVGGTVVGTQHADLRLVSSGALPCLLWRNYSSGVLFISSWSGVAWSTPSQVTTDAKAFDVCQVAGGFYLLWRETGGTLKVGRYSGATTQSTPFTFGTEVTVDSADEDDVPDGPVAIAVAPNQTLGFVFQATTKLFFVLADQSCTTFSTPGTLSEQTDWDGGLTICSRLLSSSQGVDGLSYRFVVYASRNDGTTYTTYLFETNGSSKADKRYNAKLASKAFRVGNEVFCWLHATNSHTHFLVAGAFKPQMSGVADREEAPTRDVHDGTMSITSVNQDPLDAHSFTWARPFITGQDYSRAGNSRIGDMNFLPKLSAVQYGKSVYVAGSLVRNYDGAELGDCGFHDFPIIDGGGFSQTTGGNLTAEGAYQYRVYAVRYNRRGERFMSSAATRTETLIDSNTKLLIQINTLPATNHEDVVFEIYRTEAGGTTFYLEGTVANDLTAQSVAFASTMSDANLRVEDGDEHETGVGGIDELEEYGPLGCAILAVSEDRLWGAGGQVPRGHVQFSKLKEPTEGAGFDEIAGFQEVDSEGGEITSIFGYGDGTYVLERDRLYLITGGGENNFGIGSFGTPSLHLVDGAVTHLGTIQTPVGPVYWGSDGPRLLNPNNTVANISDPVRPLTKTMMPSGVQIDLGRQEVVWFTERGDAVLWNYQNGRSRWAQWSGLKVAGVCSAALVTTDGRLLIESDEAYGDGGVPFEFAGSSGELNAGSYGGEIELGRVGIVGAFLGSHGLRFRVFYNGSPLWGEEWAWLPETDAWLTSGADLGTLTPAEIDALKAKNKAGTYATNRKPSRHTCRHFRVEWSDVAAWRPTYRPYELSLEVGSRGGMGRIAVSSFGE